MHLTARPLGLFGSHDKCRIAGETLDIFLVFRLCVADAIEVLHKCDERGAAGWCAGCVVGDLIGHFGNFLI